MKHNFLRLYDAEGKWTKPERKITVNGVEHDLDQYAKEHGIELPDSVGTKHTKSSKKVDIEVNIDGDMGQTPDEQDSTES